jgi:ABC-type nitrate/sulfonate/bicarbonate transport system substrate-binding protein
LGLVKMKRTKIPNIIITIAIAIILVITLLFSCTPPPPAQQFILRVGTLTTLDSLPYFVMVDRGLDKKYGLTFVETNYPGGAAIIDSLSAGTLDVGVSVGSVPVFSAAERGMIPGKIVPAASIDFADPDHPMMAALVAPSIVSWQDLRGKQIAVNAFNGLNAAAIKGRLGLEGIRDFTLVEIPFANMGLALAGGNIAAATLTEPYLTQSLLRQDGKFLGWIIGEPPLASIEYALIVFSASFYRDNLQAVKAFLRAHLEASKWLDQNPDGARSLLGKRLNIATEVVQKMKLPRWSLDGLNNPALLENLQSVMLSTGMLKAPIPVAQLYDETLLKEVLAEKK